MGESPTSGSTCACVRSVCDSTADRTSPQERTPYRLGVTCSQRVLLILLTVATLTQGAVVASCEHSIEPSDSIKDGRFLDLLSDHQLLNMVLVSKLRFAAFPQFRDMPSLGLRPLPSRSLTSDYGFYICTLQLVQLKQCC
jgi:hypothetical protein